MITDQQATECRRRRVDHKVGERQPTFASHDGVDLALQALGEHTPRRLCRLDADKHNNFKMTGAGKHIIISRVVVVRKLGGLLCAVGPTGYLTSLFIVTSLR